MQHIRKTELMNSTALILKEADGDDPNEIVTKALEDLTKTMNERLEAVEKKTDTTKLEERLDKIEAKGNRAKGGDTDDQEPSEERKAFGTYLRLGSSAPAEELKTLTVASDPSAGYLAPAEMSSEFIRDLNELSPVRNFASVRQTGAASVKYPTRTGITNASWTGETQESTASEPGFGQTEVTVKELTTHVDISNQLLTDSAGQAEAEVRMALAEDFAVKEAAAFVNGNGVLQPEGFMTHSGIAETVSGSAATITADSLIKLLYAMPATYRNRGAWAMNGTTLGVLRTLKDGDGRFLWQPSYQAGQPETLLGRPVIEMLDMEDIGANKFPIIYGDWSGYRILDRVGLDILVNPYSRATERITRIHAARRVGGRVLEAAKFRKLKCST